jgi:nucleoside-diphosphate-sugar epimerase
MSERALVTGGTGFIGSRLVKRLAQEGYTVQVLCRHGQVRASSLPVSFWYGDVTALDALRLAMEECSLVFHCAAASGPLSDARKVNVEGTRNVMIAAAEAGVQRIVHLSSVAVYGRSLPREVSEDQPHRPGRDPYATSKSEGDRLALDLGKEYGIQVVVLRPALVYGPVSPTWTMRFFHRVKYGQVILPDFGRGRANLVYVDDLVDALLLAATVPGVSNQTFNVNGSEAPTWGQYLGYFARMLGKPPLPVMSRWQALLDVQKNIWSYRFTRRPSRLTPSDYSLMVMSSVFSNHKAEKVLGYRPRVGLVEGMQHTENWLREGGYLPA